MEAALGVVHEHTRVERMLVESLYAKEIVRNTQLSFFDLFYVPMTRAIAAWTEDYCYRVCDFYKPCRDIISRPDLLRRGVPNVFRPPLTRSYVLAIIGIEICELSDHPVWALPKIDELKNELRNIGNLCCDFIYDMHHRSRRAHLRTDENFTDDAYDECLTHEELAQYRRVMDEFRDATNLAHEYVDTHDELSPEDRYDNWTM